MPFRSRISLASVVSASTNKPGDNADYVPDIEGAATPYGDSDALPPPVQAGYQATGRRSTKQKKTRISLGLNVRWDRFLRKLGSGTAPSTSSALDESIGESSGYNRSRAGRRATEDVDAEVDEVVVEREWSGEIKSSIRSGDHGASPEKSGGSGNGYGGYGGTNTDRDSVAFHVEGFWANWMPLIYLRYRLWPLVYAFFATHFVDEKSEQHYRKENWFLRKVSSMSIVHSVMLISASHSRSGRQRSSSSIGFSRSLSSPTLPISRTKYFTMV